MTKIWNSLKASLNTMTDNPVSAVIRHQHLKHKNCTPCWQSMAEWVENYCQHWQCHWQITVTKQQDLLSLQWKAAAEREILFGTLYYCLTHVIPPTSHSSESGTYEDNKNWENLATLVLCSSISFCSSVSVCVTLHACYYVLFYQYGVPRY